MKLLLFIIAYFYCATSLSQYPAIIHQYHTEIDVAAKSLSETRTIEIEFFDRSSVDLSNVQLVFAKDDKISDISASVYDSQGKLVKKLKKNDISYSDYRSEGTFYEDLKMAAFTLRHHEFPFRLAYTYTIKRKRFIQISNWKPAMYAGISTIDAKLKINVDSNTEILFKQYGVGDPLIEEDGNLTSYSWRTNYKASAENANQLFSGNAYGYIPSVLVCPKNFNYGLAGSFNSWEEFGNWQHRLVEQDQKLTEKEQRAIDIMIQDVDSDYEKLSILHSYLTRSTTYVNISIEDGGLVPFPPSYVCLNRYGDCKALSNYFKAVLSYVGIKSYYALINAGSQIDQIDPSFPSQQFNHVILLVSLDGKEIWVDCTSKAPLNTIGTFIQGRNAFLIDEDSSFFKKVPSLLPETFVDIRSYEIKFNIDNTDVKIRAWLNGESGEDFQLVKIHYPENDFRTYVERHYAEFGILIDSFQVRDDLADRYKQVQEVWGTNKNSCKKVGNDLLYTLPSLTISAIDEVDERKGHVQIDFPLSVIDSFFMEIPGEYELSSLPDSTHYVSQFGTYELIFNYSDGMIVGVRKFQLFSNFIKSTDYPKFHKFYNDEVYSQDQKLRILFSKSL